MVSIITDGTAQMSSHCSDNVSHSKNTPSLSVCLSACMHVCMSLSLSLSLCVSVSLCLCLSVSVSLSSSFLSERERERERERESVLLLIICRVAISALEVQRDETQKERAWFFRPELAALSVMGIAGKRNPGLSSRNQ